MTLQIALGDTQLEELRLLATKEQRPIEQLVQEAVEALLSKTRVEGHDAFESGFGLWGEGEDGLAFQERLRNEW